MLNLNLEKVQTLNNFCNGSPNCKSKEDDTDENVSVGETGHFRKFKRLGEGHSDRVMGDQFSRY